MWPSPATASGDWRGAPAFPTTAWSATLLRPGTGALRQIVAFWTPATANGRSNPKKRDFDRFRPVFGAFWCAGASETPVRIIFIREKVALSRIKMTFSRYRATFFRDRATLTRDRGACFRDRVTIFRVRLALIRVRASFSRDGGLLRRRGISSAVCRDGWNVANQSGKSPKSAVSNGAVMGQGRNPTKCGLAVPLRSV